MGSKHSYELEQNKVRIKVYSAKQRHSNTFQSLRKVRCQMRNLKEKILSEAYHTGKIYKLFNSILILNLGMELENLNGVMECLLLAG